MSVVVFDPTRFATLFPELSSVSQTQLSFYFSLAETYIDNTDCSMVPDNPPQAGVRTNALYLTVAHLAKLFGTVNGQSPSPLVGRIDNATEGSVSVGTALDLKSQAAQWWSQSQYGLSVWQMLAPWRTAIYIAKTPRSFAPAGIGGPFFGGITAPDPLGPQ